MGVNCLVYIDDVVIYTSGSTLSHIQVVKGVLGRLEEYRLRANPKKCQFAVTDFEYLGYRICESKIFRLPKHVNAFADLAIPKTVKQVERIVGMANWFRRSVMNFAGVTEAIRCVLVTAKSSANAESNSKTGDGSYRVKKGISWTAEAQKEFEHLKGILSDGSYLWIFDPALRTVLQTDASALSVGAVLFQIDEKVGKKVIGYYSHRNTGPETRYKDYDLELMAVVKAVKSFHCFLYRRKFEVWADHRALEFLKGTKLTVARQYNWLELLSQYSFTISYVRGGRTP